MYSYFLSCGYSRHQNACSGRKRKMSNAVKFVMFLIIHLTGRDSSLPLCPQWLLWYSQTPPPSRRQRWPARPARATPDRHGQRGHAPPGAGAPLGSPVPKRACSHWPSQRNAVGRAHSHVLTVGWVTGPAREKRFLLWHCGTSGYDPTSTKVSLHWHNAHRQQYVTLFCLLIMHQKTTNDKLTIRAKNISWLITSFYCKRMFNNVMNHE